jgi:acyl carrier protein
MAATTRAREVWSRFGIVPFGPEEGLEALGESLFSDESQEVIVRADWTRHLRTVGAVPPLLERLAAARATKKAGPSAPVGLGEVVRGLDDDEARSAVTRVIGEAAARILGLPGGTLDAAKPLAELGFDSLMAVELARTLGALAGRRFPTTLTYSYPTVAALAGHVTGLVERAEPTGPTLAGDEAERLRRLFDERLASIEAALASSYHD